MSGVHDPLVDELLAVKVRAERAPVLIWGVVTSSGPLRVLLHGSVDVDGLPVDCPATSALGVLRVGETVYCAKQGRRIVVVSRVEYPVPAPVFPMRAADVHSITSTSLWGQGVGSLSGEMTVTRPLWVRVTLSAWLNASTSGDTRAGIQLDGATVLRPEVGQNGQSNWGATLYHPWTTGGFSSQLTATKTVLLNPGTTTISARAYRSGTGTNNVNYPSLDIVPIRWGD